MIDAWAVLNEHLAPWFKVPGDDALDEGVLRRCLLCGRLSSIVPAPTDAVIKHEPDCELVAADLALKRAAAGAGSVRLAPASAWLLFFEDPARDVETFVGAGAEDAAQRRYEQASQSWNCTLFRAVSPAVDRYTAPECSTCHEKASDYRVTVDDRVECRSCQETA